ncbi:MAG: alpha/beta hydrolase [Proteobacteria bacterium]|nr:alpha/beta hydrolase [Pseudomonadota bacterium]
MDRYAALVHGLRDEIVCRDATWWKRYAIRVPALQGLAERGLLRAGRPSQDVAGLHAQGLALLRQAGLTIEDGDGSDPVGMTVALGLVDAARAAVGELDLAPAPRDARPPVQVLSADYDQHALPDGRRCFVARHGSVPVLVVSALGFPIDFWHPLLCDRTTALKPIVVEPRCCDLFKGGMRTAAGLQTHADDLAEALDAIGLARAAVIGWCNGGRVAVDFAARHAARTDAVLLLSPTFRGAQRAGAAPSAFEENMQHILASVAANPKIASFVSQMLRQLLKPPSWADFDAGADTSADADAARGRALLGLPERSLVELLLAPLATDADVANTVERNARDEAFAIHESLAAIDRPLFVVTGDSDSVVSNAQTRGAMSFARAPVHAQVRGAGHYIHHLQYPYLRHLMSQCLVAPSEPLTSTAARIDREPA